ncbi:MAG: RcnB family protein [Sphingomonas sp.]
MKKFILGAVAATLVASPILAAAPADAAQRRETTVVRHQPGRTVVTHRTVSRAPENRNWRRGERFDHRYARSYRVVTNYRSYHRLYTPPRGYHWVRSGNDAVLVAVTGGLIGAVVAGAFN